MSSDLAAIMKEGFDFFLTTTLSMLESALTPGVIISGSVLALVLCLKLFLNVVHIGTSGEPGVEQTSYGRYELFSDEIDDIMDEYRYEMDNLDTGDDAEYYRRWAHDD